MKETNLDIQNDAELLNGIANGSSASFECIYRKYVKELLRFARTNITSREDCEEIIQEVFISLWERRGVVDITSLRHYLFNSVRYKIIRYFQHHKVKKKYAEHYRFFELVYESLEKEEEPDLQFLREKIDACVETLPDRCKTAFRLRLYENLSNGEIARRMNITRKTVEVYIFKTFTHLRNSRSSIYKTN